LIAATINRELDVLCAMHIRARDVWEHPVRPIKWGLHRLEARKKKDNTLNAVEARSAVLLARTKNRDVADCIELSFYTGVRQNELMTVLPSRVNLAARTMVVLAKRKAKQEWRERTVYLNTVAVALLAERLENSINDLEPIFRFKNGRKIWDWVRHQIGRPKVTWHDLRHTHASLLGDATKDPFVIQRQLGHTHVQTSMNYIHTADSRMVEAVEALPALTDDRKVRPLRETALEQTIAAPEGQNIEAEKGSAGETTLTDHPHSPTDEQKAS